MPISFPDFQRISFDEANPYLKGVRSGQKITQDFLQFPQDLQAKMLANQIAKVQAQYADPMAQAGLTKVNQENEWNPRIWDSEIGLRGAQAGLAGAETGKVGTETQMNRMKLGYLQQMLAPQRGAGQSAQGGQSGQSYYDGMDGGGGQQPQGAMQPQRPMQPQQAPENTYYGIETPQPSQTDIANKMLMGMDTFAPKLENAKKQQQDQYDQYQKSIGEAIHEATSANNLSQAISVFDKAMDRSLYKGPRLGNMPSAGWLSPPGDLSPEQEADRAAIQMLPSAIGTLKDAMGTARFSNLDMNMAGKMKFDRTMTDEARATQRDWVRGINNRMMEKSRFYTMMGNPRSGAQKSEADQLWAAYQQDFPLISQDGKKFQGTNLNNWPLYTTPRAVASIKATGTYTPSGKEKNAFMMQVPGTDGKYHLVPIKKGKVESAFKKGAKPA